LQIDLNNRTLILFQRQISLTFVFESLNQTILHPMLRRKLFLIFLLSGITQILLAQDTTTSNSIQVSSKYFESISKKAGSLQENLDKKSKRELEKYKKFEERLTAKLAKVDSTKAKYMLSDGESKYNHLQEKLRTSVDFNQYIPKLDSLSNSLKFLESNNKWIDQINNGKEKLTDAANKLKQLQTNLQKAEEIKQFLKERKQYLSDQLKTLGFAKELKKINKQAYYFSQQVNEYKEALKDSKKAERKVLELLSKTKLFKDFMKRNSMLASLFRMPVDDASDPSYLASLQGLQTRTQVNTLIQNQISSGGPSAQQQFSQNIQQAQSQLQQLKDKINKLGGGSSDDIMPEGFKPNGEKTKSFLQRLELGTNIQSQKGNSLLPVTSDLALSVGYKLNDKSIIGIGASYKMGWGSGWNNIRISQQGVGLRSFIDWKLKGSFWISGGYEQNYRSAFNSIVQLQNYSAWQQSGLIGLSKTVSVKSKVFKKTKVQLLWDFLSYQQIPKTQSIIFRIGYSF